MTTEYDHYPYDDFPFALTHPDNLATIAALFGLRPAPPTRCRVLELGCGLGGNLVPMADALPESSFVGVDRAKNQIASGQATIAALGLRNIDLLPMDILEVDASFGSFDYIICHGVFSWVPAEVKERILAICREHLAPNGVAYISYNTLPGWHLRGMIRDLIRREVGPSGDPADRVARARAFLEFLGHAPVQRGPAQAWLKTELDLLDRLSDAYVYYEHIVEQCTPMYFADFARDADRAGLGYLGDAHFQSMLPGRLGPDVERAVASRARTIIDTEHLMDVMEQRSFRRSLFCLKETRIDREITHRRLTDLWVSTRLLPTAEAPDIESDEGEDFAQPGGPELRTSLPILKAAMTMLAREHPRGLPFEALWEEASRRLGRPEDRERLGSNLLGLFAEGHVDLGVRARPYVTTPGPRPRTTALIRHQAARDPQGCTTLRHQKIGVDALQRAVLKNLDGTRSVEDLTAAVAEDLGGGVVPRDRLEEELTRLAEAALLEA